MKSKKQVALIILDGWGYREDVKNNAIASANIPFFKKIWNEFPHTLLNASGLAVGLPDGQMGNSEIGHTTIGAGTVLETELVRIGNAVFEENEAFSNLCEHIKKHDSELHLMGLVSDGGVHSHINHLFKLLLMAKSFGIRHIVIHAFTDGRDTPPQSGAEYLEQLEQFIFDNGIPATIATVIGRYYAMDRDNNWDRLDKALDVMFEAKGHRSTEEKPSKFLRSMYEKDALDEHLEPIVFTAKEIGQNDGIILFNFRADRVRMLTEKLLEKSRAYNLKILTFTEYGKQFETSVAFPPKTIEDTLAGAISRNGLTQAHIAETEKFPHATYFLNGGREKPHDGEKHILVPSRKDVKTHDLAPKMKAKEIADMAIAEIENGTDFIFINFANPDMVGHSANVPAIIEALEEVDKQLERVVNSLMEHNGIAFITADHGNAELNVDPITNEPHTAHTTNLVPAIITSKDYKFVQENGGLSDITPTILSILNIPKSKHMTGVVLVD